MRINIIGTRGYPSTYGGFETLVRHLAPYLAESGHDVTVFDREHADQRRVRYVGGVRVRHSLGTNGAASSTLTHGLSSSIITAVERPDVALVMNVANGFFLPAFRHAGIPTVLNVDGIEWEREKWSGTARRVFRAGAKAAAKWSDHLVADSHEIARRWRQDFGRNCAFIPYGGDFPGRNVGGHRIRAAHLPLRRYVLIVARFVPENNVPLMLDAGRLSGFTTVVVGSGADTDENRRIQALHNPPDVHILGHLANQELLYELWANCGVYLHGHSVGGTNPSLVQAMGLGSPVLANDTAYNREVLLNEDMLVPPNPAVISTRIVELMASESARTKMGEWGKERVQEVYNWANVCGAYESMLHQASREY